MKESIGLAIFSMEKIARDRAAASPAMLSPPRVPLARAMKMREQVA